MSVRWNPEVAAISPLAGTGPIKLANKKRASRRCIAALRSLMAARIFMSATIENLGRSAGWQCGDKSGDIIDIVTFSQRGRKPRHLGAVEIVGVRTTTTIEIALIRGLQIPVVDSGKRRRAERIVAKRVTCMTSTADIDVVILPP